MRRRRDSALPTRPPPPPPPPPCRPLTATGRWLVICTDFALARGTSGTDRPTAHALGPAIHRDRPTDTRPPPSCQRRSFPASNLQICPRSMIQYRPAALPPLLTLSITSLTLTCDLDFQFPASYGNDPTQAEIKVKGQAIQKLECELLQYHHFEMTHPA